jgi:outer membrane protein TolC
LQIVVALSVWTAGISAGLADERLRLADVISEARTNNPEIRAARERAVGAAAVPPRVSAYDDPSFTYEAWNAPESFRLDHADNNIFKLSQKIPFPGKRTVAGKVAERDAAMASAEAQGAEIEVVAAVKRAYFSLWAAHQNLLVYSRDKELVERLARISADRYGVGLAAQPDVLRAQVERTKLINRVTTEGLMIDRARAELNALLSRDGHAPLGVPEDPRPPRLEDQVEGFVDRALQGRPEIAVQAAGVEKEEAKVRQARLDYLPDFDFTVSRFLNFQNRDGFGAMASVSIPFVYKYKYDAGLSEARAGLAAAQAEERRTRDRVRHEVEDAYLRARTALLQFELYTSTHIPQAEQSLAASETSYQTGKLDFLSLIDSIRGVEAVHLEHVGAAMEFEQAFADLERAVGGEISREGEEHAK